MLEGKGIGGGLRVEVICHLNLDIICLVMFGMVTIENLSLKEQQEALETFF